jgi:hypothetical protein
MAAPILEVNLEILPAPIVKNKGRRPTQWAEQLIQRCDRLRDRQRVGGMSVVFPVLVAVQPEYNAGELTEADGHEVASCKGRIGMSRPSLENRVAELERKMAAFLSGGEQPSVSGWRETIGMFSNDSLMKEIDAAGQAWREADRSRARKRRTSATKPKS